MFMFRKKDVRVSTTDGLQKEAKKFQNAVAKINNAFKPYEINISIIETIAKENSIPTNVVAGAFESYLKRNALNAIKKIKDTVHDYTVLDLEQAAEAYGYDLAALEVTYFSKE